MRRITGLVAAASALSFALPGAAHASAPQVTSTFITTAYYKVGAGYLAAVGCRTVTTPSDPQVTALSTTVHCSINGTSKDQVSPGAVAVTEIVAAAEAPFQFCVSGTAAFLDTVTNDIFEVAAVPHCITFQA
jgi:hypothetical protein